MPGYRAILGTLGRRKTLEIHTMEGVCRAGKSEPVEEVSPGQHRGDVVPLGHTGMVFQLDPGAAERYKSHRLAVSVAACRE